jgi:pSer/pThr/pTyr-binding forkhead associated (FHA) protein
LADAYSSEQRYTTVDSAHITFALDDELETGVFRIRSTAAKRPADAVLAASVAADATPQVPLTSFTSEATPYLTSVTGEEFKITQSVTNIGRGIEADIQIDDTSVSRLHCAIVLGSDVLVRDLGSTNGTIVDGTRTSEALLRDGSILKIGNITLTYMSK